MAIAEMQRARMAIHCSVSDDLIAEIQKLGCCQFIAQTHDKADDLALRDARAKLRRVDEMLGEVRFVMRFLDPYATEKGGGMAKAMGDAPELTLRDLAEKVSEKEFESIAERMRLLEKRLADARAGISKATGLKTQLTPLVGLPYSLDFFSRGTELTEGVIYSAPVAAASAFTSELESKLGGMVDIYRFPVREKETSQVISIIHSKDSAEAFAEILPRYQLTKIDVPQHMSGTPDAEIALLEGEIAENREAEELALRDVREVANGIYRECEYCSDYWNIQKRKLESLISGEQTEQIVLLDFWLPKACVESLTKIVEPYSSFTETLFVEPAEDEKPPTLLKNAKFATAMEPLITMYGTPTYGGFDPTSIVTPFFYLFFGMCFGDAGYGLLIAGILLLIMSKKQLTGTLKKFFVILTISNVMAVVVGTLTFSWFGDSIDAFPFLSFLKPLQKFQVLDPMNDPMTFLGISLGLGFLQILVGLFIAMGENLRAGKKFDAFADQGGWVIFLCGLVLVGLSSSGIGLPTKASAVIAGAGAIILVATQGREKPSIFGKLFSGIMSLYNVTGYLGDVLSYSRLLALGLGSAAVGMVINLLCNLMAGTPYIGIFAAALIFVIGHVFSIAVNILGAFVHSLRLQYVEFFGKFYEASGEDFAPLTVSTQYVKVAD